MNERLNLKKIFDAEMNTMLHTDTNTDNVCLISGETLEDNHITLLCNHKFNYRSIYEEVVQQKNNHRKILVRAPLLLVSILLPGKDECTYYSQISYEK